MRIFWPWGRRGPRRYRLTNSATVPPGWSRIGKGQPAQERGPLRADAGYAGRGQNGQSLIGIEGAKDIPGKAANRSLWCGPTAFVSTGKKEKMLGNACL